MELASRFRWQGYRRHISLAIMYDKAYYDNQKQDIQQEFSKLVFETYEDVERAVIKKLNKVQEMTKKLQKIEESEKISKESTNVTGDKTENKPSEKE
jgi:hypothetical protein